MKNKKVNIKPMEILTEKELMKILINLKKINGFEFFLDAQFRIYPKNPSLS